MRLIVFVDFSANAVIILFQFLLVRLIVCFFTDFNNVNGISIPFGAINSQFIPYCSIIASGISIPFGAINSDTAATNANNVAKFQFLLVRLIAKILKLITCPYFISIPFGAINSMLINYQTCNLPHFNSFWCD